ncbi:M3 family metallopeptidase [Massilia sp. W12]|uniref:M3 family metallopeptidase n=1 Tax=Massilia sp. W12 TaxID=3126507 RepID=UPI0030D0E204
MKMSSLSLSIASAMLAMALSPTALAADAKRPLLPVPTEKQIAPMCEAALKKAQTQVARIEKSAAPKDAAASRKLYAALDQVQIAIEDLVGGLDLIANVSPDPKVRAAAEPCLVKVNAWGTELFQNDKLYQLVKASTPGDEVDAKLRQDLIDGFEDTGVGFPKEKQEKMKELAKKLDLLSQEFARNIRDNKEKLTFTPEEVKGLPQSWLDAAKKDEKGNYVVGFEYPSYNPFMEYADNEEARKRYQIAFANHGTEKNLGLLKQAMELRRELAAMFGFNNYADYVTRRRMAGSASAVRKFLDEVQGVVTSLEKKELEELRQFKAQTLGTKLEETSFNRWDLMYWQQKLKNARYKLDQNALRQYFPTGASVDWALDVSAKLYGVSFKQVKVPTWHQDVQYYDVFDAKSGARIAGIYLDLFPREGKYGHAAAWPSRGSSTLIKRTPISVLVTNFDRKGLDGGELETLVHEFGHVLHGVLSQTRYVRHSGTSVELDFVEAPSQMYEEWARRLESLANVSKFCKPACPTVDEELAKRMTAAHNYGRGIRFGRQLVYANFDLQIHDDKANDPMAVWRAVEGATPLGHVPGTHFPGQFGHVMGGYGAGYYGYMWSEVMALDMLSAYSGKIMDPAVGMRYRNMVLGRGGEKKGRQLVTDFLGREPNSKAFFAEISGQRLQ